MSSEFPQIDPASQPVLEPLQLSPEDIRLIGTTLEDFAASVEAHWLESDAEEAMSISEAEDAVAEDADAAAWGAIL
jgi:hypothetical protein